MNKQMTVTFGSLFAGIGGFDLGMEAVGMKCEWQVENAEFSLQVLNRLWPDVPKFHDIRDVHSLWPVNVMTAGFPCPKFSRAGREQGFKEDNLFFEIVRLANEQKTNWLVLENVAGFASKTRPWREIAIAALKDSGYDIIDFILDARDFGIPQSRRRWVAICVRRGIVSSSQLVHGVQGNKATNLSLVGAYLANPKGRWTPTIRGKEGWRVVLSDSKPMQADDGLSGPVRTGFKRAYGNAMIPQMAEFVGSIIMKVEGGSK